MCQGQGQCEQGDPDVPGVAPTAPHTRIPATHSTHPKGLPRNLNFSLGLQWDLHV